MLLNVKDFPSVQAALDAAAEGDRIYLPGNGAGTVYSPPPTSAWKITKSLEIFGDGPGEPGSERGTSLKRGSASNLPIFEITPAAGSSELGTVVIRGMKLFRPSPKTSAVPHTKRWPRGSVVERMLALADRGCGRLPVSVLS